MTAITWNVDDLMSEVSTLDQGTAVLNDVRAALQGAASLVVKPEVAHAYSADLPVVARDLEGLDTDLAADCRHLRDACNGYRGAEDDLVRQLASLLTGNIAKLAPVLWLSRIGQQPTPPPARPGQPPVLTAPRPGGPTAPGAPPAKPKPVYTKTGEPPRVPVGGGEGITQGDTGPKVVTVQDLLAKDGFYPGPSDGEFGPATMAQLLSFQKAAGLQQTGKVDAETMKALLNPTKYLPAPPPGGSTNDGAERVKIAESRIGSPYDPSWAQSLGIPPYEGNLSTEWCALYVSWVCKQSGHPLPGGSFLGVCDFVKGRIAAHDPNWHVGMAGVKPGDVVIYSTNPSVQPGSVSGLLSTPGLSHTGIATSTETADGGVQSCDGNWTHKVSAPEEHGRGYAVPIGYYTPT